MEAASAKWTLYGDGWWHDNSGRWHHQPTGIYYNVDPLTQQYVELKPEDILLADAASIAAPQGAVKCAAAATAMQGRRPKQEDRHILYTDLRKICHDRGIGSVGTTLDKNPASIFGLYDGHMGAMASDFCAKTLHMNIVRELTSEATDEVEPDCVESSTDASSNSSETTPKGKRSFERVAMATENEKKRSDDIPSVYRDVTTTSYVGYPHLRHISRRIHRAFLKTDKEFIHQYRVSRDGCTAVVALILGEWAYIASIGDSAAILAYRDEMGSLKVTKLSIDHKPDVPSERARIEKNGAKVMKIGETFRVAPCDYEQRCKRIKMSECSGIGTQERPPVALAVSRAFGDREFKTNDLLIADPDVVAVKLDKSHLFIFMACDGIWDVMTEQEVAAVVQSHKGDPQAASSSVVRTAFQRGSQDNLTALTIYFSEVKKQ
eukprot:GHVN01089678.1.p1 GENE.GHVN01089678.1~~GHVN01089678.1.p1  ORF type:complete len:434 (+),score=47.73 GHVN01089678.1:1339-2640(+)